MFWEYCKRLSIVIVNIKQKREKESRSLYGMPLKYYLFYYIFVLFVVIAATENFNNAHFMCGTIRINKFLFRYDGWLSP